MLAAVIALYVYSARGGHPGTFLFSELTHVAFSPQALMAPMRVAIERARS